MFALSAPCQTSGYWDRKTGNFCLSHAFWAPLLQQPCSSEDGVPLRGMRFPATLSFTANAPLERSARCSLRGDVRAEGIRKVAAVEPEPDRHQLSGTPLS